MQYVDVTELVVAGAVVVSVVVADRGGWRGTGHVRLISITLIRVRLTSAF